jgi:ketosteroid isomerase-like protein
MKAFRYQSLASTLLVCFSMVISGCQNKNKDEEVLLQTIEDYENAWASGDFLKVESYFAEDAKRLHTEPYVWDRKEIKRYFEERAALNRDSTLPFVKNAWKKDREYLEIRVEENLAYDVFTTDRFKALHIWGKQEDGSWKILYDVGMLNNPCENE